MNEKLNECMLKALLGVMFYLASRVVQKLALFARISHCHSSLDWQPPNFDWSKVTEMSLLLLWGLHDMGSLPAPSALWRRKKHSLEGLLAAQQTLTQPGTPTWRWTPAEGGNPWAPGMSGWLFVVSRHGCGPIVESWNLILNWGSQKVALHPLQVLQPAVQLASFNGTLGPRCTWGARDTGRIVPLCY